MQLHTQGSIGNPLFNEYNINLEFYGDDPDAPMPKEDNEDTNVTVPSTSIPLSQESLQYLLDNVQECRVQLYITTQGRRQDFERGVSVSLRT